MTTLDVTTLENGGRRLGKTALLTAGTRWLAGRRSDPICRDEWAGAIAGEDGRRLAQEFNRQSPANELYIAVRTAYLDQQIQEHCRHPNVFPQVVLLGAGLDTRAARLAAPGVRFFEVDHPQAQEDKLSRLRSLGNYPIEAARYVPYDLASGDLFVELVKAGFRSDQPAFVLMEGVACYLEEDQVCRIFAAVADGVHPHSRVVFDYIHPSWARIDSKTPRDLLRLAAHVRLDEPLKWVVETPIPMLHSMGFRHVHLRTLEELSMSLVGRIEEGFKAHLYTLAHASPVSSRSAGWSRW